MKIVKWLDENLEEFLMLILLAVISVVIMMQVFMRYFMHSALSWPEELCRFCFVYTGALSAGYCLRKGVGIRVDLLLHVMPKPLKILMDYAGKILTIVVYALIFYHSIILIGKTTTLSTAMQVPMKWIYAAFPLGMGLGIIRGIQDLITYTKGLKTEKGGN